MITFLKVVLEFVIEILNFLTSTVNNVAKNQFISVNCIRRNDGHSLHTEINPQI